MSLIDRAIHASAQMALRIQPRRVDRVAGELLYSSPSKREDVAEIRRVGILMVSAGLTPPGLGRIALRSGRSVTVTEGSLDLVDARHLRPASDDDLLVRAAARVGAALLAFPEGILSGAQPIEIAGLTPTPTSRTDDITAAGIFVTSQGVISVAPDLQTALDQLMATELLVKVGLNRKEHS